MSLRSRRPSPSLVVSVVAVVLASAGSATAASLITGAQIRDGSVTGKDIRDGSLTARDLAASMRVAGAVGPAGPAGPAGPVGGAGPAGPQGATGPQGAPGPAGADGAAGAPGLSGYEVVVGPPRTATGEPQGMGALANCPAGKVPIGGGGTVREAGGTVGQTLGALSGSHPAVAQNRWQIFFEKGTMQTVTIQAYAICAQVAP